MKRIAFAIIEFFLLCSCLFGEQTLQLSIGNSILRYILKDGVSKKSNEYIHNIDISVSSDGIIDSIQLLSNSDIKNPTVIDIAEKVNEIHISTGSKSQILDIIRTNGEDISIVGPHFTRKSMEFMKVVIRPGENILYETSEISLGTPSGDTLKEQFLKIPSDYSALDYSAGVLLVRYKTEKNIMAKYVFSKKNGMVKASYYYNMGDEYDMYSPPIELRGTSLHSANMKINVINYFILKAAFPILSEILFQDIFLGYDRLMDGHPVP